MHKVDDRYDVVIVGAGIAGLVCGCYLAKAGRKVLIVEKEPHVGGYCCSFKKGPYQFDAAVHAMGAFRQTGVNRQIYNELNLGEIVTMRRVNPSDIVITRDHKVNFWNETPELIKELAGIFPSEKTNIVNFFKFIENNTLSLYSRLRKKTMGQLLDASFTSNRLKAMLSIPMLTMWIAPRRSAAIAAIISFKEFIRDGGYYPEGGMQSFADALLFKYKYYGGTILLQEEVVKLNTLSGGIESIRTDKQRVIKSDFVVSCADCRSTYLKLIGLNKLNKKPKRKSKR